MQLGHIGFGLNIRNERVFDSNLVRAEIASFDMKTFKAVLCV